MFLYHYYIDSPIYMLWLFLFSYCMNYYSCYMIYYFMNIPVFLWYWLVFIFAYFSSHFHIYLNKSMFIIGFFSLFLGSWLEVKKRPKTLIHLRIFRTKKKPNTWSKNLLLLEEEDRTLNAPIHSHLHGQTAAVIPDTGTRQAAFSRPGCGPSWHCYASARGHIFPSIVPYLLCL